MYAPLQSAEREDATDALKDEVKAALAGQFEGREKEISGAFRALTKKVVRQRILRDKVRIDRAPEDTRLISLKCSDNKRMTTASKRLGCTAKKPTTRRNPCATIKD